MSPVIVLILAILSVPILLYLQYKIEKKFLFSFNNINDLPQQSCLNEFNIRLIQLAWMPLTGRCATTILFKSSFDCAIYNDFVIFSTKDNQGRNYSRIVNKQNISVKKDLFAGNVISFNVDGVKLVLQVYSRDLYFK